MGEKIETKKNELNGNSEMLDVEKEVAFVENSDVKKSKQVEAKELIESSKELVSKVDNQVEECKIGVSKAAENFDNIKRTFNNTIFTSSQELLEKVGFEYNSALDELNEPFELALEEKEGATVHIKNISSGRFTGLLLAIGAALVTLGVWIYFAAQKLNISLSSNTTAEAIEAHINPVLAWIGGGITGATGNPMFGALVLGFSALLMAWFVYAIRVNLKASKNLRIALKTYEESTEYSMSKDDCKKEMEKIDAHLQASNTEVENFTMLLNEQNSSLKRILHVEGAGSDEQSYHPSSTKVMRDTERLMRAVEKLLNTSVTSGGKLNFKSEQALSNAQAVYIDFLGRIYD
ncbi:hypothetical protein KKC13_11860 [bacterium]|nr:hypothetical protein [bacterium]MBU1958654.1 hypothetical protein [bacterium]